MAAALPPHSIAAAAAASARCSRMKTINAQLMVAKMAVSHIVAWRQFTSLSGTLADEPHK